jgi:NAD(P)-dependent dehydrogenase (short-subunit alcohol dehydrogenase family)
LERLKDKVAIVTGGAQGIGAALARRFQEEGARVVIADLNRPGGEALAQSIGATFVEADVADHDAVGRMVSDVARQYGRLDTIVSNAAIFNAGTAEEMLPVDWRRVMDVNLAPAYHLAHFAAPHLRKQAGASIVILASVQGMVGFRAFAAYAAAKGGLIALTRQLAVDLAPQVRVNAISPGTILSRPESRADPAIEQVWAARHLLGRAGMPVEVANAALFLASDEASFITGHNLVVDGGLTARGE